MKYRVAIKKVGEGIWYMPQVLKWPEWLGVWKGIGCNGRELGWDNWYTVEEQAYLNIKKHKQNQIPITIKYKYL